MSSRARLFLIIGITIVVMGGTVAYSVSRFATWHRKGWAGVFYAPNMPESKGRRSIEVRQVPGEVVITYANSPADGRFLSRDRILTIDGIPISDHERLGVLTAHVQRGSLLRYGVERGGKQLDVTIRLSSPFRSPFILARVLVAFVVAGTFLLVGLLVIVRRPRDPQAVVFYVFAIVSAVAILGNVSSLYEQAGGNGIIVNFGINALASILVLAISVAYAPLTLHLALIFPRQRPILGRRPYLLRWIYAGAALTTALFASIGVLYVQFFKDPAAAARGGSSLDRQIEQIVLFVMIAGGLMALQVIWSGRREGLVGAFSARPFRASVALFGLFLGIASVIGRYGSRTVAILVGSATILVPMLAIATYPVFACVALVHSYRAAGPEERRQVQWPLWGLLIALLTKIAAVLVQAAIGVVASLQHELIPWRGAYELLAIVPAVVTLAIPISFAFAILKYRLMNIDVIIRKTVVYAILSTAIIVVYIALVGGVGTLLVKVAELRNQTMVIAATLIVALLFVPLRNRLQTLVDRNLFRTKYDYPEALRVISAASRAAADANELLSSVAETLQQALHNRSIVVFAEKQGDYIATAKVGPSDAILGRLRIPRDIVSRLHAPFDPRTLALPESMATVLARIETVLVVPIERRAFIAAGPRLSGTAFEAEDLEFLGSAGDEIAAGLERIRVHGEEADYAQARAIQETLLPRAMPHVAGVDVSGVWLPARTMGGDYYDLIELGERELALCIGDVAGKGMTAALTMSGLQAAVRASASDSPRDLCERVRRVVVSSLSGGRFVTFFYATVNVETMRLRWCNAGHNAPILARADGTTVRLAEGGPAITRLFRDTPYEEHELALHDGDRIVLFTDGVSEVSDENGEMFGEPRIEELVAANRGAWANELQQVILDAATAFGGGQLEDDLTIVVAALGERVRVLS
jgi:serine phosphatase RsbU (regulator of sigma subunit)